MSVNCRAVAELIDHSLPGGPALVAGQFRRLEQTHGATGESGRIADGDEAAGDPVGDQFGVG